MATDREMLLRIRDGLQKARVYSNLAEAMYVTVIDHLAKPQPASKSVEAWVARDKSGENYFHESPPEWDKVRNIYPCGDNDVGTDETLLASAVPCLQPAHSCKIRITVEQLTEPEAAKVVPEPKWRTEVVSAIASTISSADGVYRFTGRDNEKRAAELAEFLNSKDANP